MSSWTRIILTGLVLTAATIYQAKAEIVCYSDPNLQPDKALIITFGAGFISIKPNPDYEENEDDNQ